MSDQTQTLTAGTNPVGTVCTAAKSLPDRDRRLGLKAIGMIITKTTREGWNCVDVHYYVLRKRFSARNFAAAIASHWAIENQFRLQLDDAFRDDHSRICKRHADVYFSTLRMTGLTLLMNEKTATVGIKDKWLYTRPRNDFLRQVLVVA